jgi:hypothetical protein
MPKLKYRIHRFIAFNSRLPVTALRLLVPARLESVPKELALLKHPPCQISVSSGICGEFSAVKTFGVRGNWRNDLIYRAKSLIECEKSRGQNGKISSESIRVFLDSQLDRPRNRHFYWLKAVDSYQS